MTQALFGGGRGRVLVFCWLGWVFDFYDLILFSFLKHGIAEELGLPLDGAVAWIEGWSLLATAVGGFAFGRVADRVGEPVEALVERDVARRGRRHVETEAPEERTHQRDDRAGHEPQDALHVPSLRRQPEAARTMVGSIPWMPPASS